MELHTPTQKYTSCISGEHWRPSENVKKVQQFILLKVKNISNPDELKIFWNVVNNRIRRIAESRLKYFAGSGVSSIPISPRGSTLSKESDVWSLYALYSIEPYLHQILASKSETYLLNEWLNEASYGDSKDHIKLFNVNDQTEDSDRFYPINLGQTEESSDEDSVDTGLPTVVSIERDKGNLTLIGALNEAKSLISIIIDDKTIEAQNDICTEIFRILNIDGDCVLTHTAFWGEPGNILAKLGLLLTYIKSENLSYALKAWIREDICNISSNFDIDINKCRQIKKIQTVNQAKKIILKILKQNSNFDMHNFQNELFKFIQSHAIEYQSAEKIHLTIDFNEFGKENWDTDIPFNNLNPKDEFLRIFDTSEIIFFGKKILNKLYEALMFICNDHELTNKFSRWLRDEMPDITLGKEHDINLLCDFFANVVLDNIEAYGVDRKVIFNLQRKKLEESEKSNLNHNLSETISESTPLRSTVSSSTISTDDVDAETIAKIEGVFSDHAFKAELEKLYKTMTLVIDWEQYKIRQGGIAVEGYFTPRDHTKDWNQDHRINKGVYKFLITNKKLMGAIRRICKYDNCITKLKERLYNLLYKDSFGVGDGQLTIVDTLETTYNKHNKHTLNENRSRVNMSLKNLRFSNGSLDLATLDEMRRRFGIILQKLSIDSVVKWYKEFNKKFIDMSNQEILDGIYRDVGQNQAHQCTRGGLSYYKENLKIGDKKQARSITKSFLKCFDVKALEVVDDGDGNRVGLEFTCKEAGFLDDKTVLTFLVGWQGIFGHHMLKFNFEIIDSPYRGLIICSGGRLQSYKFSDDGKQIIVTTRYHMQIEDNLDKRGQVEPPQILFGSKVKLKTTIKLLKGDEVTFVDTLELERKGDPFQVKVNLVKSAVKYTYTEGSYEWYYAPSNDII